MDYLEMLSRKLEDVRFIGPNLRPMYPCPQSVMPYLDPDVINNPNRSVNSLTITSSRVRQESGFVNDLKGSSKYLHNSEQNVRSRRRQENFKHPRPQLNFINNKYKKNIKEINQSVTESLDNPKDFYDDYMLIEDVKKGLESGELFEGFIRISQKCTLEAYVPSPDKSRDILINSIKSRNRALDGDKVVVKILDKCEWRNPDTEDCQRTGIVVYILEQKLNPIIVGYVVIEKDKIHKFLIPRDMRFPKLLLDSTKWPHPIKFKANCKESQELFYATILYWDHKFPIGLLKGNLGTSGSINAETKGLLLAYHIDEEPYPKNIDQYFPPPFVIEEELKHRKDFRKHCIFSIDPPTAKDLDDALSCVMLPNGNYEIGIHISDVSHFVKHGTPLDEIAEKLATSVYLVQRVYHMLPPALTLMASLLPGTDKLAVSIVLEMSPDANVISHSFCRSIIHSCAQLHYSHAQIFLENPEKKNWDESEFPLVHNGYTISDCAAAVCHLHKLASIMRKRRFNNGALSINQPKLSFELDKNTCVPLSCSLYILHESNWLIEEYMLLANTLVAEHLKTHFPKTAMLRNHQSPDISSLEKVVKYLKAYNIDINIKSAGSIQKSKEVYCQGKQLNEVHREIIINHLLSKPMIRAEYCVIDSNMNMSHYALNVPYYTHFTSPIRRYPDIVVHRLLISWLTNTSIEEYENPDIIEKIAKNSNDQKYNAKRASDASTEIYAVCFIGQLRCLEDYALAMDIKENYFEATVISMNINVRVYVNINAHNRDMKHKSCQFSNIDNKPTLTIVWDIKNDVKQIIQLFSKVKLKLTKRDNCMKLKAILIQEH